MSSKDVTIEEQKKSLYSYWRDLPYFKTMDTIIHSHVEESEVKSFIIKYIRDGIEDEFGKANNLSRRHAFTASELHKAYTEKQKGQKYSQSNFHFHIKKLVEDGYLIEIAKLLEGRHYITYYGRTAIAFIGQYDNILTEITVQDIWDPLRQFITAMNPTTDSDTINQMVDKHILLMQDFYYRLFSWIEDKYPMLYKSKVDLKIFLTIAGHFSFYHTDFRKISEELGSLLELDKIMSYERYQLNNKNSK